MNNPFATLISPPVDRPCVQRTESVGAYRRRVPKPEPKQPGNPWGLTNQEASVLTCLLKTGCNKAVAHDLGVEHKTVELHLYHARKKMGAQNRVMGVLMWERHQKARA